jgi:hypothetical protein
MARILEISLPKEHTHAVVSEIQASDHIIGIQIQRQASLKPPGDLLRVSATTDGVLSVMQLLESRQLLRSSDVTVTIMTTDATLSQPHNERIRQDFSDATWEEMESQIAKEGNIDINAIGLMMLAGAMAAVGIATNAIHVVIGAMVVAPGFEPILRIPLAIVSRGPSWRKGLADTAKAYAAILVGAAATTWVLQIPRSLSFDTSSDYLPVGVLVLYWTSLSLPSILVTGAAGIVGALVVAMRRSVLTAGVMIALALIPSAALVGMALVVGSYDVAGRAGLRWLVEVAGVLLAGLIVFGWKQLAVQKRSTSF